MAQFPTTRTTAPKPKPADATLTFGKVLTDHMFLMNYEEGKGWHNPRIEPYGPLSLDPATSVLHYGQAIFDGLKAFRGDDGQIRLFRPDRHAERFNRSAKLMSMPEVPVDIIRQSFDALVGLDADWVPRKAGTSLYLRPTIIATDVMLGVHPVHSLLYFLILSPVFVIQPRILENGGSTVSALIALRYGEATQFGTSALMAAGLALFVLTLVINFAAGAVVARSRSGAGAEA